MRILITGGAGFIGSNLTLTLQERHPDAEIVVLDDFSTGHWSNLKGFAGDIVTADLSHHDWMVALASQEFSQIYHLAARDDDGFNPAEVMNANVDAFRLLLEFAAESQTPIVYASGSGIYGAKDGAMREDDAPDPQCLYAFSKCIMENVADIEQTKSGGDWKIVGCRIFSAYGPHECRRGQWASEVHRMAAQMAEGKSPQLCEGGEQSFDFIHVSDVVEGLIAAMDAETKDGIYNLGTGVSTSLEEVGKAINRALGTELDAEYISPEGKCTQPRTLADTTLAQQELGFRTKLDLQTGINEYMRWLHPARFAPRLIGGA